MQTLSVHSSFRAGLVDFLKTVVAFAPVSYVTAKAARPSRELFRIDRAMVDGSHGIGLCDRRVCASKSEESARYRSESARDVCSFLVLRVFACSVYLMPIVVGTATASVDGVHKGYVEWGKNGRWFFGAVLGFLTCVGSIGVFRDVALYKKVLGGRAKRFLISSGLENKLITTNWVTAVLQQTTIFTWLDRSRKQYNSAASSKESAMRAKVISASSGTKLEKLQHAFLTPLRLKDDLKFEFSQAGRRGRVQRVKRITFETATDPVVILHSLKMVCCAFLAQLILSWFRLAPYTSVFAIFSRFIPGVIVCICIKISRDICESILTEPYPFRPDTLRSGTNHVPLEPLMRAMRGEYIAEYAFSQILAFDDCLKIASENDYGRLHLLYGGSDAISSAALGVVAPGIRRTFAADNNVGSENYEKDDSVSPDFLEFLSTKRAFLACALAPVTQIARVMRDFEEKAIIADARSSAGPMSFAKNDSNGLGMGNIEEMQMRKHRESQALIASVVAANMVEDFGALANLGIKIATAMFNNKVEFGDEMSGDMIERRANVLGENERPTFRDAAIATCAFREATMRVREVTFPDSVRTAITSIPSSLSSQRQQQQKTELVNDEFLTKATTTTTSKTSSATAIMFQSGWSNTHQASENSSVSHWSNSIDDAIWHAYPALAQLQVAEIARKSEDVASSAIMRMALISKNGKNFARPGSRVDFLERFQSKPESPPILGDFKSKKRSIPFSANVGDDATIHEREKDFLQCSYFGDVKSHEKVLALAVSSFVSSSA